MRHFTLQSRGTQKAYNEPSQPRPAFTQEMQLSESKERTYKWGESAHYFPVIVYRAALGNKAVTCELWVRNACPWPAELCGWAHEENATAIMGALRGVREMREATYPYSISSLNFQCRRCRYDTPMQVDMLVHLERLRADGKCLLQAGAPDPLRSGQRSEEN